MSKRFYAGKAEQEANEIGLQFAYSKNVVRDMSRAYHVDFSDITVHTDAAADSKVKAAGKDAIAQGKDIFFGKGIYESSEPDAKALVAHEFVHTMQQGAAEGAGGVQESAPMGAEQGGLRDWFRKKFGKKKQEDEIDYENMQISEPKLVDDPTSENFNGYHADGESDNMTFRTTQSRALYELAKSAGPEELRNNAQLRKLIMEDYKTNMSQRLEQYDDVSYQEMFSAVFREDHAGEMKNYYMMMLANLPQNLAEELTDTYMQNPEAAALPKDERGEFIVKNEWADPLLDYMSDYVEGDETMQEILKAGMEGYGNSKHFTGENEGNASNMLMSSLILRGAAPMLADKRMAEQQAYVKKKTRFNFKKLTPKQLGDLEQEALKKGHGAASRNAMYVLQKNANLGKSNSALRFRNLLKGRFR